MVSTLLPSELSVLATCLPCSLSNHWLDHPSLIVSLDAQQTIRRSLAPAPKLSPPLHQRWLKTQNSQLLWRSSRGKAGHKGLPPNPLGTTEPTEYKLASRGSTSLPSLPALGRTLTKKSTGGGQPQRNSGSRQGLGECSESWVACLLPASRTTVLNLCTATPLG